MQEKSVAPLFTSLGNEMKSAQGVNEAFGLPLHREDSSVKACRQMFFVEVYVSKNILHGPALAGSCSQISTSGY